MNTTEDKAISRLDLEPVKRKLMRDKARGVWSRERVDAAERDYRRFLFLVKAFPNELAAPSMDVDRFWHYHIVDTAKYARDCEDVFGYFLHRYPYLGMGSEDDASTRLQAGMRMRELYAAVFGSTAGSSDTEANVGFSMAVQPSPQTEGRRPDRAPAAADDDVDEPGEDGDLLDQIRFVVTENQRYDRMSVPLM